MPGPMDMTVSTPVVVTVRIIHFVTNRRVTVTGGVSLDIQLIIVPEVTK